MEQRNMDRISELTRLSRERALTDAEQAERAALRREYLDEWRRSTVSVLENTYIQTPDGKKHKLQRKK
jgi:uncharacterized protein YnzC (UPF0291/DUF896 family)